MIGYLDFSCSWVSRSAWPTALLQVRSPAPPLIALVGLLGMVLGEQAIDMAKHHFAPPAQASNHTQGRS